MLGHHLSFRVFLDHTMVPSFKSSMAIRKVFRFSNAKIRRGDGPNQHRPPCHFQHDLRVPLSPKREIAFAATERGNGSIVEIWRCTLVHAGIVTCLCVWETRSAR